MEIAEIENLTVSPLSLIFLVKGDKVLTLKRAPDKKIYPNKVSGFGGKVEPGEELFESAKREIKEETNLEIDDLQLRGTFIRIVENKFAGFLYLFCSEEFSGEPFESTEEGEVAWKIIKDVISDDDTVDHVKLYLKQILEGKDFYTGIGYYEDGELVNYSDNVEYFAKRLKKD